MMPARKAAAGSYRIADRGLDKGMRMLANGAGKEWFVGDEVDPNDLDKNDIEWLLEQGVIEVVS